MNLQTLKEYLISIGLVVDNIFLDKYCSLILENINTKKERLLTNKHHIIPISFFKINNMEINNSQDNIVNLSYKNHFLAHYFLCLCATQKYVLANQRSIDKMFNCNFSKEEQKQILKIAENYEQIMKELRIQQSIKNSGKGNPCYGKVWTKEERERQSKKFSGKNHPMYATKHNETWRKHQSESLKGPKNWNYNRKWSKERIEKLKAFLRKKSLRICKDNITKLIAKEDLQKYLDNGWIVGFAEGKKIEYKGEKYSIETFCKKFNLAECTVRNKIAKEVPIEQIISEGRKKFTKYNYLGKEYGIVELCKSEHNIYHLKIPTIVTRIQRGGWSVEKALTTPVKK